MLGTTSRVHFQKVAKKYREYLMLYRLVNNGSVKGAVAFDYFYWSYNYYYRSYSIERHDK